MIEKARIFPLFERSCLALYRAGLAHKHIHPQEHLAYLQPDTLPYHPFPLPSFLTANILAYPSGSSLEVLQRPLREEQILAVSCGTLPLLAFSKAPFPSYPWDIFRVILTKQ